MIGKNTAKKYGALVLWLVIALAVASLIIHFTGEPASVSTETSKGVLRKIFELFGVEYTESTVKAYNHLIRKSAHFILFFSLGFSLRAAAQYQRRLPKTLLVLVVGGLFAIGDEVHQFFVPGRGPGVRDVLIDFSGVVLGALAVAGIVHLVYARRRRREMKNISDAARFLVAQGSGESERKDAFETNVE